MDRAINCSSYQGPGRTATIEIGAAQVSKRIVKTPKLYFLDTGLCCYLAGLRTEQALLQSSLLGAFFETHVYTQLRRHLAKTGRRVPVYFFRDHSGIEIDFVLAEGEKLRLIEVKWSELPAIPHAPFEVVSRAAGEARIRSRSVITPSEDSGCARETLLTDSVDWTWLDR